MSSLREIVETPGMPAWVRGALLLFAAECLRVAAAWGEPMVAGGWTWAHGVATLVPLAVAADLLHSAVRKRWPLLLFADLFLRRVVRGWR